MAKNDWDEYGLYHLEGKVWATGLIEIEPKDGRRRWEAIPICLGKEEEVMKEKEDERISKPTTRAASLPGKRLVILLSVQDDTNPWPVC